MIGISKSAAILSLVPNAEFVIREGIVEWHSPTTAPVSEEQIAQELSRLQQQYEADSYKRNRQAEYPPIGDQLDALWKGGVEAEAMLAKVQAVKAKYPKGVA
jgi:hypothetical protein